jgi:CheY-like chemotaxis protein
MAWRGFRLGPAVQGKTRSAPTTDPQAARRRATHNAPDEEFARSSSANGRAAARKSRDEVPAGSRFSGGNGELILVVDDEECVRMIASQILTRAGYRVVTAENGAEGLALYKIHQDSVELVISDMMMPVMDGPTMVGLLRRENPRVRIVVASGCNADSDRAKFTVHKVKQFLPKPYSAAALMAMVKTALAARPRTVEVPAGSRAR